MKGHVPGKAARNFYPAQTRECPEYARSVRLHLKHIPQWPGSAHAPASGDEGRKVAGIGLSLSFLFHKIRTFPTHGGANVMKLFGNVTSITIVDLR